MGFVSLENILVPLGTLARVNEILKGRQLLVNIILGPVLIMGVNF